MEGAEEVGVYDHGGIQVSRIEREGTELVQVAAVAVASLENMRFGQAQFDAVTEAKFAGETFDTEQGMLVLDDVQEERARQDEKWGTQEHGRITWAMILAEEFGEWAEELRIDDQEYGSDREREMARSIVTAIHAVGTRARFWLESIKEWPEAQQVVYDGERTEWPGGRDDQ